LTDRCGYARRSRLASKPNSLQQNRNLFLNGPLGDTLPPSRLAPGQFERNECIAISETPHYRPAVETGGITTNFPKPEADPVSPSGWLRLLDSTGGHILHFVQTVEGLVAFALITLGVALTKFNASARVIH